VSKYVSHNIYIRRQNRRETPQRCQVALRSWIFKQTSFPPPLKRVQWQAAVTQCWSQTVPHCGTVEVEAALAHWRLCSWHIRCRLQSGTCLKFFSTGTQNFCQIIEVLWHGCISIRVPQSVESGNWPIAALLQPAQNSS